MFKSINPSIDLICWEDHHESLRYLEEQLANGKPVSRPIVLVYSLLRLRVEIGFWTFLAELRTKHILIFVRFHRVKTKNNNKDELRDV